MLGEALVDIGVISAAQLDEALTAQQGSGALLGEVLLSLKMVSEAALSRAIASEARVPFVPSEDVRVDRSVAVLVPESFARRHLLAPARVDGGALEVLQVNPLDVLSIDELRQIVSMPILVRCATLEAVRRAIDACYATPRMPPEPRVEVPTLAELGFNPRQLEAVTEWMARSGSLVLISGPDGSGRTTTLQSLTHWLTAASKRVLAIDAAFGDSTPGAGRRRRDPVPMTGFRAAFESAMTAGVDAIVVDDIRDAARVRLVIDAARAGVLVVAGSRARDAVGAVRELLDAGVSPDALTAALAGVVSQRLIRLVCRGCAEPVAGTPEMLARVGLAPDPGVRFRSGRGCPRCGGTGYRGRLAVFEVLPASHRLVRQVLTPGSTDVDARQTEPSEGYLRLVDAALTRALFGETTLEEVVRIADA
jgi:hypothetical protein